MRRLLSFAVGGVLVAGLAWISLGSPGGSHPGTSRGLRPDFDAAWGTANYGGGRSGPFTSTVHRERISIVDDPAGLPRKVARFSVYDNDIGPTPNPRAQLELPRFINEGDEVWQGVSVYLPRTFPKRVGQGSSGGSFITQTSMGAPPYAGTAAVSFGSYRGSYRFGARLFGSGTYAWSVAPRRGVWQDYVLRIKLGTRGFVEVWYDRGHGLVRQRMTNHGPGGSFGRVSADGYRWIGRTFNRGAQYPADSRLALYYARGMFVDSNNPLTVYYGPAKWRVRKPGDSTTALLAAVAPRSYGH